MASYQQNYDAQSYQTNPYQLPTQQIIGAIQQRNQYWDSGASNLKNAYQNYLGLQLTRGDNQEHLNQLMQGVNENLQKVSKTDLSIGENYGQALNIFDPIVKDSNIMGDNAITKHYQQELSTAQNYRTKDNGKEYSETNVRDLTNHLSDFARDPNASNWRQYYASRSFYTPYTDVAAEVRQVGKDFKPDIKSLSTPLYTDPKTGQITTNYSGGGLGSMTGRMLNETDKSIIASQYRAFMDAHLSDKAKNQLAIEGRVKYHDNIGALAQDYSSYNQDKINTYKNEISRINAQFKGATPDEQSSYNDQINRYQAQIKELGLQNTKMAGGDFSNITPYKDQIAGSLHTNNYIDYLSKASAQRNIDIKYTPDQVWNTMYKESNENNRFNIAKQTQWDIAQLNNDTKLEVAGLKMSGKFGANFNGVPTYGVSDNTHNESFGVDEYTKIRNQSDTDFKKATDALNGKIKEDYGVDVSDPKLPADQRDAATQKFLNDPRNSYDVKEYYKAAQKKTYDQMTFQAIDDFVNNKIKTENPNAFNYRQNIINGINQGQTLSLTPLDNNGQKVNMTLSADDVRKLVNGTHPNMRLGTAIQSSSSFTGPGMGSAPTQYNERVINFNGRQYKYNYGVIGQSLNKLEEGSQQLDEVKAGILNQQINRISGIEKIWQNDKNPYYNAAHNIIKGVVAGSSSEMKPEDLILTDKDAKGGVYFKVQGDPHIDMKDVRNKVEAAGGRYVKAEDKYYLPGDKFGFITNQPSFSDDRLSSAQRLVDFKTNAEPNGRFSLPAMSFGNRNFGFKVDVQNGQPVYRVTDPYSGASYGKGRDNVPFSTLQDAAQFANSLGNFTQEQYINYARTIGNVPTYQQPQ